MRKHSYEVLRAFPFTGAAAKRDGAFESVRHTVTDEETGQARVYIEARLRVGDRFVCIPHDIDIGVFIKALEESVMNAKEQYRTFISELNNKPHPTNESRPRPRGRRESWRG
jgi:hypothetical protein